MSKTRRLGSLGAQVFDNPEITLPIPPEPQNLPKRGIEASTGELVNKLEKNESLKAKQKEGPKGPTPETKIQIYCDLETRRFFEKIAFEMKSNGYQGANVSKIFRAMALFIKETNVDLTGCVSEEDIYRQLLEFYRK